MEFINDVIILMPEDLDLKTAATFMEGIKKVNPRLIISTWNNWVVTEYRTEIEIGDFSFFEDKDYSRDMVGSASENKILEVIERIRKDVKSMGTTNKNKTLKYMQNLTKLSDIYFS
tara:strand:- start:5009 stop:5356 length:348 start_codon:yes stop_codon:yes gene_type:complete